MTNEFVLLSVLGAIFALSQGSLPRDAGTLRTGDVARYEPAAIANVRAMLADEVVEGCVNCHKDSLSLASFEADELAKLIAAIIRSEVDHIVPIAALSDEDLETLAKVLAGPDDDGAD